MGTRCADHMTPLYPQKLALTSPTGGGRSVGIVRSRTKATEFFNIKRSAFRGLILQGPLIKRVPTYHLDDERSCSEMSVDNYVYILHRVKYQKAFFFLGGGGRQSRLREHDPVYPCADAVFSM